MDDATFWQLVDLIDGPAIEAGDPDAAVKPLRDALTALPLDAIASFDEQLAQKLYALDGRVFADYAGDSGSSDDAFLYARCYVVARGKSAFETVLKQPSAMPDDIDKWLEDLLYVGRYAGASKTGCDVGEWESTATVSYESGSNPADWPD